MKDTTTESDVVLIGGGIMSATLGMLLHLLNPRLKISIFEQLKEAAIESTDAWNNAGTGHSAFCELNYTPEDEKGNIEIKKAIEIAKAFETSKEFWSYLVEQEIIDDPTGFINSVPHMSLVWGDENIQYLKKRYTAMVKHPLFADMQYSEDPRQLEEWIPLIMKGRGKDQKIAATYMVAGTDVNFGALTRKMLSHLTKHSNITLHLNHQVKTLKKNGSKWKVKVKDLTSNTVTKVSARFVFIGAGGGALHLLEKSKIPEGKGFGGFPVSGQWLICNNKKIIEAHNVKAYGKASVGSPPMSVPHLDTRIINKENNYYLAPTPVLLQNS